MDDKKIRSSLRWLTENEVQLVTGKKYAQAADLIRQLSTSGYWQFYRYKATVKKIVDGDTLVAEVDMGFDIRATKYVRLHGVNAPELNSTDPAARISAQASKDFLSSILPVGTEFWVDSKKLDPYKRPIAVIYLPKNLAISVNQMMIDAGHAVKA